MTCSFIKKPNAHCLVITTAESKRHAAKLFSRHAFDKYFRLILARFNSVFCLTIRMIQTVVPEHGPNM